jgi:hypothetical protein
MELVMPTPSERVSSCCFTVDYSENQLLSRLLNAALRFNAAVEMVHAGKRGAEFRAVLVVGPLSSNRAYTFGYRLRVIPGVIKVAYSRGNLPAAKATDHTGVSKADWLHIPIL